MRATVCVVAISLVAASLVTGTWAYALGAVGLVLGAYAVAVWRWLGREMPLTGCDELHEQ